MIRADYLLHRVNNGKPCEEYGNKSFGCPQLFRILSRITIQLPFMPDPGNN
jgi:hypothetical protein